MALDVGVLGNLQQPNPMGMLGNVVNTANAAQQFQAGSIALQAQRQANTERQNLIQLFQNDPDAKPNADGTFNPTLYAKVLAAAPQTGQEMINKLATNNQVVTQANKAQFNLGQEQNQQIAEAFQDARGKPAANAVKVAGDLKQKFPALGPRIDIMMNQLNGVDPTDQQAVDGVLNHNMALTQTLAERKSYTQPDWAVVPIGPKGLQTQRNVEAPGGAVSPVQAQQQPGVTMGVGPSYQPNALGVPTKLPGFMPDQAGAAGPAAAPPAVRAAAPAAASAATSKTWEPPTLPPFPDKPTADTVTAYTQKWRDMGNSNADPNSGYQAQAQVYKNLKGLLDRNPNLGPGSAAANQFIGRISTMTGQKIPDLNTAYQEATSYLDRLSAQQSTATGAANKFQDVQAAGATGNPEVMGPPALKEKLLFGASVNEAANAHTQAATKFQANYGPRAAAAGPQFESAWAANADPIAFRLMSDRNLGDDNDYKATLKKASPLVLHHYENLLTMLGGKIPNQ